MNKNDTHTWLHNPDTDGFWQCPNEALDIWLARGWEKSDPPPEENPAIAERLAAQEAEREAAKEARQKAKDTTEPTKPAARGKTEE